MSATLAISVRAPWAHALMHLEKDIENRAPTFPRWHKGAAVMGRVWVHASAWPFAQLKPGSIPRRRFLETMGQALRIRAGIVGVDCSKRSDEEVAWVFGNNTALAVNVRSHIVGSIEVHGYRTPDDPPDSPWYVPGSLGILVRDPRPLAAPVPAKGALGWWKPNDEVMAQLQEAGE